MRVDLPREIEDALAAVAALDDTPADMLACILIADGLLRYRPKVADAAAAIARLAGDNTTSGVGEGAPPSPDPTPDTQGSSGGSDGEAAAPGPEDTGGEPSPRADDGPLPADNGSQSVEEVHDDAGPVTPDGDGEGDSPGGEAPSPDHPHRCDECGRLFATSAALGGHLGSHRRRRKPDGCQLDDCDDSPVKARGLCARHYRAWEDGRLSIAPDGTPSPAHPPEDDRHLCEDCGQTFKTAAGLGSHRRSHVRTPEPRTCENCGETAAKNQPLRQGRCKRCDAHLRQHGEERPIPDRNGLFPCPDCGQIYRSAAGLGVHRGRYCKPEASTDRCEECGGPVPGGVGRWCGVGRCVAADAVKPWSWSRRAS